MKNFKIDMDLQEEVIKFIKVNQYTFNLQNEHTKFNELIPPSIQHLIMEDLIRKKFQCNMDAGQMKSRVENNLQNFESGEDDKESSD